MKNRIQSAGWNRFIREQIRAGEFSSGVIQKR
jgi:hypothetical protein